MNDNQQTEALIALLDSAHARNEFDGVALVARGDTVLCRHAVGYANREHKITHTLDRPFPICSITKQFTALLVMQEMANGTLRLDAPVADYLPEFKGEGVSAQRAQITVKHLLTHQSGLPNTDDIPGFYENANRRIAASPDYVLGAFLGGTLAFAPGSQFRYNNADYLMLSLILQKITGGLLFSDLLFHRVLQPLVMKQTSVISGKTPRRVPGYEKTDGVFGPEPFVRLQNFGAAGAMQSTVEDLFRWNRALLTDRLLPRSTRDLMWTPDSSKGYVACGSWVYGYLPLGTKTPTLVERQGGTGGIFAQNLLVPEDDIAITLLSNIGEAAHLAAYTGKSLTCDLLRTLY